jgi:hypothetical protein
MSVVRVVHNRENPYVQLNKEALWNQNLSLKAIGLWARCMSRPDDWSFNVAEMAKSSKEGKRAIYSAIDELLRAGYAIRVERVEKDNDGKFSGREVDYIFFEFPPTEEEKKKYLDDFNKSFRRSGFGNCRNAPLLKKEEETKDRVSPSALFPLVSCADATQQARVCSDPPKKESPREAQELAQKLLSKVLEIHPKLKAQDLSKWAKELELLNRVDRRPWEEISSMIDWAFEDAFWVKVIQSPKGLRKNWDKMAVKRIPVNNKGAMVQKNRSVAMEIKSVLQRTNRQNLLFIGDTFVRNGATGDSINLDLVPEKFEEILCKWFKLKKE